MEKLRDENIYQVTTKILNVVSSDLQASSTKAHLANLRQSINQDMFKATGVFPMLFANIPDKYLGRTGELTTGERSIVVTMQLFALHQQGFAHSVNTQSNTNLGSSLQTLRQLDNGQAIDRRFNALVTSTSFYELTNHLRHLIKLLKSKTETKINYAQLAEDLFWFQNGYENAIRLKWSRSFYRNYNINKGEQSDE